MKMSTKQMTTVTHDDGSYSYEFEDGVSFGPYGPGQCDATHTPSGEACKHMKGHMGCHATFDQSTPAGTMKRRWGT